MSAANHLFRRLLPAFLAAACLILGCGGTEPGPGKTLDITPAMRASCPENPLQPEFQAAGKAAAQSLQPSYPYRMEIYDDEGDLVREWEGEFDPAAASNAQQMIWDKRDSRGRLVPSGYYFVRTTVEMAQDRTETRTACVFVVHEDDRDKLK